MTKEENEKWLERHGFEFTDDAPAEVSPQHRAWLWERAGVLVYALWLEEHETCRAVAYYYSKYDDTPTYSRAKHDKSVAKAVMHCMGAVSDMLHVRGRAEQNNVDASSLCVNQFIYDVTEEKK